MIEQYLQGKTLVQIDAANLESSAKDMGMHIDYRKLKALFDNRHLTAIRYYTVHHGTENQNNFFTFLKKAVDAVEMLEQYETEVLFSGDSDFHYLINFLKRKGRQVLVVSSRYHVSRELVASAGKYIDLNKLQAKIARQNKSPSFATGS